MKHYNIEEFLSNTKPITLADEVEKKISLLYDFCILAKSKASAHDKREEFIRKMLLSKGTITAMSNTVRDLLTGTITLNDLLRRNGYVCS